MMILVHMLVPPINEYGFKYAHKKSCMMYSSQESFYPGGEEHPSSSSVGDIEEGVG